MFDLFANKILLQFAMFDNGGVKRILRLIVFINFLCFLFT